MKEHLLVRMHERWGLLGFDQAFPGLELVHVEDRGEVTVRLPVGPAVQNLNGSLHGGASATLVDIAGTLALVVADRDGRSGVTTDLNVSYFQAATGTVLCTAKVLRLGRTLGFITADIFREADGVLCAQGRMTKHMGNPPAKKE
jgi:acyl-coenzyme A thioesterase 13